MGPVKSVRRQMLEHVSPEFALFLSQLTLLSIQGRVIPRCSRKRNFNRLLGAVTYQGIMARVSRALAHLSVEEVLQKIQSATNFWQQQKWLVVYNALVDPRPAGEIALHTATSVRTVHQVISDYNRLGATLKRNSRQGRQE